MRFHNLSEVPPALLLIDIQLGMDESAHWGGERNNPDAEALAAKILNHWRAKQLPLFHVKHNSTQPNSPLVHGKPGNAWKPETAPLPSEPIIEKSVNSAFIGTNLEQQLRKQGIKELVIVGLTTDHCVSTTVRMAANFGFSVFLVSDATATFGRMGYNKKEYFSAQQIHSMELAVLNGEFAAVVSTEEVISALQLG